MTIRDNTVTEPAITFERYEAPRGQDFKVLINGEHRAAFRSNAKYHMRGYDLDALDGKRITSSRRGGYKINQGDFEEVVRAHLKEIPTLAEIERAWMIDRAERENRQRDSEIADHKAEVRRKVLCSALEAWLAGCLSINDEEEEAARKLLAQYRGGTAWTDGAQ